MFNDFVQCLVDPGSECFPVQPADGMIDLDDGIATVSQLLRHHPRGVYEVGRTKQRGRKSKVLEHEGIVHAARAAGPSVSDSHECEIAAPYDKIGHLFRQHATRAFLGVFDRFHRMGQAIC